MYSALLSIVDDLDAPSPQFYLKSDQAREKDSLIRQVIEAGVDSVGNLDYK